MSTENIQEIKKEEKQKDVKKDKKAERQKERELQRLSEQNALNVQVSFEDVQSGKVVYGHFPLIQSQFVDNTTVYTNVEDLNKSLDKKEVLLRCRVHNTRSKGKGAFLVLRDGCHTVQALHFKTEESPEQMVKYIGNLTKESIVEVTGTIVVPDEEIRSSLITQKDVEIVRTHH
jgi:aspartyl-tRNA synthetase